MRPRTKVLLTLLAATAMVLALAGVALRPRGESLHLALGTREIEFLAPRWLVALALAPPLWLSHHLSLVDLRRVQRYASLALRMLLMTLLVLALSRPTIPALQRLLSVVVLVDVSESISPDQLVRTKEIVSGAWRSRGDNEVRVLPFALHPQSPLGAQAGVPPRIAQPAPSRTQQPGTDIQAAIQHAYGLFPADRVARLVLISDGNETSGDGLAEAYRARQRQVRLFAYTLPERRAKEILVQTLRLPAEVRVGAPFQLSAQIYATHQETVRVTLYKDDLVNALDGSRRVDLHPGRNTVHFKSLVNHAGVVDYRVALSKPKQDTWPHNNEARALLPVIGRPHVLYLDGDPQAARALHDALAAEEIDVELRPASGLPRSPAELGRFDMLILSDVPATHVGSTQMAAIQTYVRDLGGGLLMIGGPDSFGAGGYYGTQIERLLPVSFDSQRRQDQASLAMVLCIDRSGSMSGPKLELAKDAAKATSEILGPDDMLGVVAFDSSAHTVVHMQRAANRLRIASDIARLRPGGGTSIYPALREAYAQLQLTNAKIKHVILLSDGQSSYGSIAELVDQMVADNMTISAVGVGSGADRTLLQMVAERGGGRFYHTDDPHNIPKIFTKETTQVAHSALVEVSTRAHVAKHATMLKGIDMRRAPALNGYVSTSPKPLSETILQTDGGEPLLVWWRVGLGKTAAFTSDAKPRWAANWLGWKDYGKFWAQLVREVIRHPIRRGFELRARIERDRIHAVIDARDRDDRFINGLRPELTVFDPRDPSVEHRDAFAQTAAGYYEADIAFPGHGAFLLRAKHYLDGQLIAESLSALSLPYPREYTQLLPNNKKLRRLAKAGGGALNPALQTLFDSGDQHVRYRREIWSWLLMLALALFPLDVLLRRVRL